MSETGHQQTRQRLAEDVAASTRLRARGLLRCTSLLMAQSGRNGTAVSLSAFGAKRTWDAGRSRSSPPLMTQSGHRLARNPAVQRLLAQCGVGVANPS